MPRACGAVVFHDRPARGGRVFPFNMEELAMNQRDLNRAVANATGEAVDTIANWGFSLLDPEIPEIGDEFRSLDWDEIEPHGIGFFPDRQQVSAAR